MGQAGDFNVPWNILFTFCWSTTAHAGLSGQYQYGPRPLIHDRIIRRDANLRSVSQSKPHRSRWVSKPVWPGAQEPSPAQRPPSSGGRVAVAICLPPRSRCKKLVDKVRLHSVHPHRAAPLHRSPCWVQIQQPPGPGPLGLRGCGSWRASEKLHIEGPRLPVSAALNQGL